MPGTRFGPRPTCPRAKVTCPGRRAFQFVLPCLLMLTTSSINSFTPIYLTWNLLFWHSDQSIYHKIKSRPVHSNSGWFCFLKYGRIRANSADPDETARMSRLIWIYTVCKPWTIKGPLGFKWLILRLLWTFCQHVTSCMETIFRWKILHALRNIYLYGVSNIIFHLT